MLRADKKEKGWSNPIFKGVAWEVGPQVAHSCCVLRNLSSYCLYILHEGCLAKVRVFSLVILFCLLLHQNSATEPKFSRCLLINENLCCPVLDRWCRRNGTRWSSYLFLSSACQTLSEESSSVYVHGWMENANMGGEWNPGLLNFTLFKFRFITH